MYTLVTAEVHRIKGEYAKAQDVYDSAIDMAKSAGNINVVGVANEQAMKFYLGRKMERAAKVNSCLNLYNYPSTHHNFPTSFIIARHDQPTFLGVHLPRSSKWKTNIRALISLPSLHPHHHLRLFNFTVLFRYAESFTYILTHMD